MTFSEYFWSVETFPVMLITVAALFVTVILSLALQDIVFPKDRPRFRVEPITAAELLSFCVPIILVLTLSAFPLVTIYKAAHSRYLEDERFLNKYRLTFSLDHKNAEIADKIVGTFEICSRAKRVLRERMHIYARCNLVTIETTQLN